MKSKWRSKTFWVAVVTILVGAGQSAAQNPVLTEYSGTILACIGVLNLFLRFVTKDAIK